MQCTECVAPLNKIGVLLMQYVDFLFFRKCWNKSALKKLGGNWRNLNNEWLYDDIKKLKLSLFMGEKGIVLYRVCVQRVPLDTEFMDEIS